MLVACTRNYAYLQFVHCVFAPSQLPRQITINVGTLHAVLPVEVAWYFAVRTGIAAAQWLLVVANTPYLAAGLAVRAGVGINVTWAVMEVEPEDVSELQPYANDVTSKVTICDGLPPVRWNQSSS